MSQSDMLEASRDFLDQILSQAADMDAKSKRLDEVWPDVLAAILGKALTEYRSTQHVLCVYDPDVLD